MLEFLSGRTSRLTASAVALSAVVGGTVAYANSDKTITLTVDGQSRTVEAGGDTVRDLLADEQIPVSQRDIVAPSLDTQLADDQEVVVRLARPLTVALNGKKTTYWTTELTVAQALDAVGVREDGARLSASRSAPLGRQGLAVDVFTPKTATVRADGKVRKVTTTAATVEALLDERDIDLRPSDKLSVRPSAPVVDGIVVGVTRVDRKRIDKHETVTYTSRTVRSEALYKGERKVVTKGANGHRRAQYSLVFTDGRLTSRTLLTARVVKAPVQRVVQIGTKARPVAEPATTSSSGRSAGTSTKRSGGGGGGGGGGSVAGADGLNWAALAKCESGGNPRAVNPNGHYGLYQFSLSTWRSVGGSGNPVNASASEQTYRAKVLYKKAGAGQWSCGSHLFD